MIITIMHGQKSGTARDRALPEPKGPTEGQHGHHININININ